MHLLYASFCAQIVIIIILTIYPTIDIFIYKNTAVPTGIKQIERVIPNVTIAYSAVVAIAELKNSLLSEGTWIRSSLLIPPKTIIHVPCFSPLINASGSSGVYTYREWLVNGFQLIHQIHGTLKPSRRVRRSRRFPVI
jgi:hypothetical protein